MKQRILRPFVKWAGGKRRISHFIEKLAPKKIDRYIEPFLGSGAVFFHLVQTKPKFKAILCDSNDELINLYKSVRDNITDLIEVLGVHEQNYYQNPQRYYYHVRDFVKTDSNTEKAARLLFLNKTCYNGLYRVNKSGFFNVPHGKFNKPIICNAPNLQGLSTLLNFSDVEIICQDYKEATKGCISSDFIYLDPPNWPLSKTTSLKDCAGDDSGLYEQIELYCEFTRLSENNCTIVLSNSNSPLILELYANFKILTISTSRLINKNVSDRKYHTELIITNRH